MDSDSSNPELDAKEAFEVEISIDTTSNSALLPASPGINLRTQVEDTNMNTDTDTNTNTNTTDENLAEKRSTLKWLKAIIVMAFSAALASLSISFTVKDGKLRPESLFLEYPISFPMFIAAVMVAFFSAVNGIIFMEESLYITRACNLMALVALVLSFSVLLCALLPANFGWPPLVFFAFTSAALLYRFAAHWLKTPRS